MTKKRKDVFFFTKDNGNLLDELELPHCNCIPPPTTETPVHIHVYSDSLLMHECEQMFVPDLIKFPTGISGTWCRRDWDTYEPWPAKCSNQFILEWMFVTNLKIFLPNVSLISCSLDTIHFEFWTNTWKFIILIKEKTQICFKPVTICLGSFLGSWQPSCTRTTRSSTSITSSYSTSGTATSC